jgi:hypothetical protein
MSIVPLRHIAGHLLWSTSGTVWGVWRLTPLAGRYLSAQQREQNLAQVASWTRSLPARARLLGLCAQVDPGEIAERMVKGVDLARCPAWAQTAEAYLDVLDGQEMHRRTLWLAVPLSAGGRRAELSAAWTSAAAEVTERLGGPPRPVPADEVEAFRRQAAQVAETIGPAVRMRPARPAEIVWIYQHATHRGLLEPLLGQAEGSSLFGGTMRGGELRSPSYADLGLVRLLEGGQPTGGQEEGRRRGGWWRRGASSPVMRRWLQVETETGAGYQALLALAEMPEQVAAEHADVLAQLDALPMPVDFVVDLTVVPSETARRQIAKKKREMVDQADQYGAQPAGLPAELRRDAGRLGEMDARMAASSLEVEVQAVTILAVWGPTPQICEERARMLSSVLKGADYRSVRAPGLQDRLFTPFLPGAPPPPEGRQFVQHQLSEDWALAGGLTVSECGDPTGALIGADVECGTPRPVLLDIASAPQADASGSLGVIGDLGSGKSVLQKLVELSVVDRGGRAVIIDRTPMREWARFAAGAAPGRCQIIDAAKAELSIDPLRLFGGQDGAQYAESYLTLQLGVGPMSTAGAVLHRAVKEAAASRSPSMAGVLDRLRAMAEDPRTAQAEASSMRDLLEIVADAPLARMVFDPRLPVVSLAGGATSDMAVVTTAGLTLPPKDAFVNPDLLRAQPLEALIGRAVLYLIAAMARRVAFTDPRFSVVGLDECYWLTSSAEGLALAHEIVHDGRKHNTAAVMGAHDAEELGSETLRGLLGYRVLARTSDPTMARRGLEFLGLPPTDELVQQVAGLSPIGEPRRAGEMFLRSPHGGGRIGLIQTLVPPVRRIADHIFTTPQSTPKSTTPDSTTESTPSGSTASTERTAPGKRAVRAAARAAVTP